MNKCRRVEEALRKGKYGESLDQLPNDLQDHLAECGDCRESLESLMLMEGILHTESPVELSMSQRARIRMNVLDGISNRRRYGQLLPRPLWSVLAGGLIVLLMILQPWRQQLRFIPEDPVVTVDSETYAVLLDYTVDPILLNDENIETAIIRQSDSELLAIALEEWTSTSIYDESVLSGISELEDSDWDNLRRYLI